MDNILYEHSLQLQQTMKADLLYAEHKNNTELLELIFISEAKFKNCGGEEEEKKKNYFERHAKKIIEMCIDQKNTKYDSLQDFSIDFYNWLTQSKIIFEVYWPDNKISIDEGKKKQIEVIMRYIRNRQFEKYPEKKQKYQRERQEKIEREKRQEEEKKREKERQKQREKQMEIRRQYQRQQQAKKKLPRDPQFLPNTVFSKNQQKTAPQGTGSVNQVRSNMPVVHFESTHEEKKAEQMKKILLKIADVFENTEKRISRSDIRNEVELLKRL